MQETGFNISTLLGVPVIILALITVIVIFIRRSFKSDVSNLLMLLSCLLFTKNLLGMLIHFAGDGYRFYQALFNTSENALLILLFTSSFQKSTYKYWMNYLLAAYIASAFTLHLTQNSINYLFPLKITEAVMMVLLSLVCLFVLISNKYIFIFQSPLFWIAGGSWFYFSMLVMGEWLDQKDFFSKLANEKDTLLGVFAIMRMIMYLVAALIKGSDHYEEVWKNFKESSQEYHPQQ